MLIYIYILTTMTHGISLYFGWLCMFWIFLINWWQNLTHVKSFISYVFFIVIWQCKLLWCPFYCTLSGNHSLRKAIATQTEHPLVHIVTGHKGRTAVLQDLIGFIRVARAQLFCFCPQKKESTLTNIIHPLIKLLSSFNSHSRCSETHNCFL